MAARSSTSTTGRLGRVVGSVRPTRRGVGFLVASAVLLVGAPVLSLPALLAVSALLLGLVVLAAAYVLLGQSRIAVERTFSPEVVAPGASATATVRVSNLSVLPALEARWVDTVPHGLSAEASGVLPPLGGSRTRRSRVRFSYPVQGLRRGRHALGPLRVEATDPFGLVVRRHVFGEAEELVVLPRRHALWPLTPHGADHDGASRAAPQNAGIGEDDVVARSYLPGDALKRMHWKATAHRGELMVRQEEQQVNPRAGIVLDTDARSHGTGLDRDEWVYSPELEWAVSATASVLDHLVRIGYAVAVRAPGDAVDRVLDDGDMLDDALVDLAVLEPAVAPSLDDVDPGERTVVAVLGRPDVERATAWADALSSASTVLAMVSEGTRPAALDVLADAGWRVATYTAHDDVAELWSTLGVSRTRAAS